MFTVSFNDDELKAARLEKCRFKSLYAIGSRLNFFSCSILLAFVVDVVFSIGGYEGE